MVLQFRFGGPWLKCAVLYIVCGKSAFRSAELAVAVLFQAASAAEHGQHWLRGGLSATQGQGTAQRTVAGSAARARPRLGAALRGLPQPHRPAEEWRGACRAHRPGAAPHRRDGRPALLPSVRLPPTPGDWLQNAQSNLICLRSAVTIKNTLLYLPVCYGMQLNSHCYSSIHHMRLYSRLQNITISWVVLLTFYRRYLANPASWKAAYFPAWSGFVEKSGRVPANSDVSTSATIALRFRDAP